MSERELVAPVRLVKKVPGKVRGVCDRAYDGAIARPAHAVKVLGIVVAVLGVLAGLVSLQADRYARLDVARAEAVRQGEAAVGRLLSYSFRTSDRQVARTRELLSGRFKDDYARFVDTRIVTAAKDKKVSVQTTADRAAVVSSSPGQVVLLMYVDTDSEAHLGLVNDTALHALRITLEREAGSWKVTALVPV